MKKKNKILINGLLLSLVIMALGIILFFYGCKEDATQPEEEFSINGVWQNHKDEILDGIRYDFLQTYFNLNENGESDGYFLFDYTIINLSNIKIIHTGNDINITADSEYWDVKDIVFRGNLVGEEIHGYLTFKINGTDYSYLMHMVKQSIQYLPKR